MGTVTQVLPQMYQCCTRPLLGSDSACSFSPWSAGLLQLVLVCGKSPRATVLMPEVFLPGQPFPRGWVISCCSLDLSGYCTKLVYPRVVLGEAILWQIVTVVNYLHRYQSALLAFICQIVAHTLYPCWAGQDACCPVCHVDKTKGLALSNGA